MYMHIWKLQRKQEGNTYTNTLEKKENMQSTKKKRRPYIAVRNCSSESQSTPLHTHTHTHACINPLP